MEPRKLSQTPTWSFTLVESRQDPGECGQGLREKRWHWDTLGSLESTWISGEGKAMEAPLSSFLVWGGVLFPPAGVSWLQGDARWRESHDPEAYPVQEMGEKCPIQLMLSQDSSPFRSTGKVHQYGPVLLGQVRDSCWGEAEISSFERMQGHGMRDIVSRSNPVPFNVDYSQDNAEVFWKEGIIRQVHISHSTWANTIDVVLKAQVPPSTAHLLNRDIEAKAWLLCLLVWRQMEATPQTPAASACTFYPQPP